ncbi:MAG: hypothetical protein QM820_22475 [Minicystis sp.]
MVSELPDAPVGVGARLDGRRRAGEPVEAAVTGERPAGGVEGHAIGLDHVAFGIGDDDPLTQGVEEELGEGALLLQIAGARPDGVLQRAHVVFELLIALEARPADAEERPGGEEHGARRAADDVQLVERRVARVAEPRALDDLVDTEDRDDEDRACQCGAIPEVAPEPTPRRRGDEGLREREDAIHGGAPCEVRAASLRRSSRSESVAPAHALHPCARAAPMKPAEPSKRAIGARRLHRTAERVS